MTIYTEYWSATMIRGIFALVAATAIMVIPELASILLFLPFALVISAVCLAAYGTLDSALVLVSSFLIPRDRPGRLPLRIQGIVGSVVGVLLFALVYGHIDLRWFLYLAAIQAATAALTEFSVARGTSLHHGARWCYASAAIALVSSIALLLGRNLNPRELAWLLYGYLAVFGLNLFAISARMLFAERHHRRPALG